MSYILTIPLSPSFVLKGLKGYRFQPLRNQDIDIYILDVQKGHDTFIISKTLTRIYYIIEGKGYFTIDNQKYDVEPGMLVEVPPNVEYSYSGTMKLILISNPRWFKGNEKETKKNPDVFSGPSMISLLSILGFGKKIFPNRSVYKRSLVKTPHRKVCR